MKRVWIENRLSKEEDQRIHDCLTNQKKPYLVRYQEIQYKDVIVWAKDSEEADAIAFNYAYNNEFVPYGDLDFDHWDVDVLHEVTPKEASLYMEFNKDSEKSMEENEKSEWTSKDEINSYVKEMRQIKEYIRVNTIDEKLKSLNGDGAFQIVRVRNNSDALTSFVVKGLPKDVLEQVKQSILENKIDLNEYPEFKGNDFTNTGLWLEYDKDDHLITVTYCFDDYMELCTFEKEKYPEIVLDIKKYQEKSANKASHDFDR